MSFGLTATAHTFASGLRFEKSGSAFFARAWRGRFGGFFYFFWFYYFNAPAPVQGMPARNR